MAIFDEIILILIGIGFVYSGWALAALESGFAGKFSWPGALIIIAGVAIVATSYHYGPITISFKAAS